MQKAGTKSGFFNPTLNDKLSVGWPSAMFNSTKFGAGKGIRTLDPDLGKVVLYQLSYSRVESSNNSDIFGRVKCFAEEFNQIGFKGSA